MAFLLPPFILLSTIGLYTKYYLYNKPSTTNIRSKLLTEISQVELSSLKHVQIPERPLSCHERILLELKNNKKSLHHTLPPSLQIPLFLHPKEQVLFELLHHPPRLRHCMPPRVKCWIHKPSSKKQR